MELDRKDLKIEALRQKVAKIVTDYEDKEADLRVEVTLLANERDQLQSRVNELEAQLVPTEVQEDTE